MKSDKSLSGKKVLVAMSGGVDSSVAAQLLKNQGYDVSGVFLHFWKDETLGSEAENRCCSLESLLDARAVAGKIGIPFYTFNFSGAFKKAVVDNFLSEYGAGRTPNPCVVCNKRIKLGLLLKHARALGFDYVASGHYLNIKKVGREFRLFKAKDKNKDQSYFLYTFTPAELKHLLFPLGTYTKPQVRKLAAKFGLKVAAKPESQDICFLSGSHNNFLKKYLKLIPGDIRTLDTDKKIGEHQGLPLYTIGQRRGLVGGTGPYYAAKFDYRKNILYVVKNWDERVLYKKGLIAKKVNWLSGRTPRKSFKCGVVIRYGHPAVSCVVTLNDKSGRKNKPGSRNKTDYLVTFAKPQRAVTPGQSVVFYNQKRVLGGGIIAALK
ncbi:MAG: tRNA 2-thiouridine(34) synthase MnmA [Candidatus Falkowbacteria bacterium]|nr:tRNA 2-thiouridine(34) synthase MnmA [Candidatus Falkowbacteria bacterium]